MDRAIDDLPDPDSPISASVLPGAMSKDTPATARTTRRQPMRYEIDRFSTRASGTTA